MFKSKQELRDFLNNEMKVYLVEGFEIAKSGEYERFVKYHVDLIAKFYPEVLWPKSHVGFRSMETLSEEGKQRLFVENIKVIVSHLYYMYTNPGPQTFQMFVESIIETFDLDQPITFPYLNSLSDEIK
jgi:hypothetical protein